MILGAAVDMLAGYLLSRVLSYQFAVVGFALGAAAFACLSSFSVVKRFRALDYYYFASAA
ncbi:MAG: hypothetical protein HY822_12805 [Acidobacteria bacterium]|nr:hypothetical protein [Acidobacteriota bacterium]